MKQVPGIPYVCLRIPTGGGKTLVACEAVNSGAAAQLVHACSNEASAPPTSQHRGS